MKEGAKGSGFGVVEAAENGIGGVIGLAHHGGPGHATFYVEVEDPGAYLARAEKLGGKTVVPHRGPRVRPDPRLLCRSGGERGWALKRCHPVGRRVPPVLSGRQGAARVHRRLTIEDGSSRVVTPWWYLSATDGVAAESSGEPTTATPGQHHAQVSTIADETDEGTRNERDPSQRGLARCVLPAEPGGDSISLLAAST